jgi:hypothetical protein
MFPTIHIVALCLCGGNTCIWKFGAVIHSSGICRASTRKNIAIRRLVHIHILLVLVQLVNLCKRVSVCGHLSQMSLSCNCMACSLWFVGIMSCATIYHVVCTRRDRTLLRMFVHTFPRLICGCFASTLGIWLSPALYLCNCAL